MIFGTYYAIYTSIFGMLHDVFIAVTFETYHDVFIAMIYTVKILHL